MYGSAFYRYVNFKHNAYTYCAGKIVDIDETMIPFRGRLKFRD